MFKCLLLYWKAHFLWSPMVPSGPKWSLTDPIGPNGSILVPNNIKHMFYGGLCRSVPVCAGLCWSVSVCVFQLYPKRTRQNNESWISRIFQNVHLNWNFPWKKKSLNWWKMFESKLFTNFSMICFSYLIKFRHFWNHILVTQITKINKTKWRNSGTKSKMPTFKLNSTYSNEEEVTPR